MKLAQTKFLDLELGNTEAIKSLVEDKGIDTKDSEGRTLIHVAAMNGNLELAKWCISKGANLITEDLCGFPPLVYAILGGWVNVADLLKTNMKDEDLDEGLDVEFEASLDTLADDFGLEIKASSISSQEGYGYLHIAAAQGHLEIFKWLIDNKCTKYNTKFDLTPLHYAAARGKLEIIKQSITPGGLIRDDYVEICRKDLSSKDNLKIMMDLAFQGQHLELMSLLVENGASLEPELMYRAYFSRSVKTMEWLKDKGVDPNVIAKKMVANSLDRPSMNSKADVEVNRWIVKNIDNPAEIYLSYPRAIADKWDIKLMLWAYGHNAIGEQGSEEYRQNAERFFASKHCSIGEKLKLALTSCALYMALLQSLRNLLRLLKTTPLLN